MNRKIDLYVDGEYVATTTRASSQGEARIQYSDVSGVTLKRIKATFSEPVKKRAANPAPRIGTARPRRVSQITKKAPAKRLVKRRRANTDEGYFPNPVEALHATFHYEGKEFNYAVIQRHKNGDVEAVALVPGVEDARLLVRMLNTHAPAGVNFLVMKR
jgi:hypothetical protein